MVDSTKALGDCRELVLKWQHIADSTKEKADTYLKESMYNLDAKRAAEAAEQGEHSKFISSAIEANDFKRKARHRTVIIIVLLLWNGLTGYYIVSH